MQDTQWSIKVVEKSSRRPLRCIFQNKNMHDDDAQLMRDSLTMRTLLLGDLVADPSAKEVSDWRRTVDGLSSIDVEAYADSWKAAKTWLTSLETQHKFKCWAYEDLLSSFKRSMERRIHYKWIRNSVQMLLERRAEFWKVLQWIVFDEKLNFRHLDLSLAMSREYREDEIILSNRQYDLPAEFVKLCREVAMSFELGSYPFRPKHGPGATAETDRRHSSYREKNLHLKYDADILAYCRRRYISADIPDSAWFFAGETERVLDTAELVCVPKSMTRNRTISKEPVTRQYLQQDGFLAMDDWFSSHPLLRYHIDLHDQELSRHLALRGSRDGSYSTIDLSKASDTVTCSLVQQVFGECSLVDMILSTRSTHCLLPDGSRIRLEKVAGMGNALCFPVECLIFSLCCEYACRSTRPKSDTRYDYRVFGDDIVIRSDCVPALLEILQECGFTVNEDKSFTDSGSPCFREACGVWGWCGIDITPLRLSRRLVSPRLLTASSAPQAVGIVSLANETFRYGFMNLNRGIHAMLRRNSWYYQLFRVSYFAEKQSWVSHPMPYLLTWDGNDTQWRVYERYRPDLQRTYAKCAVVKARARCSPGDENDYFSYWIHVLSQSDNAPREEIVDRDFNTAGSTPLAWGVSWVAE